MAGEICPDCGTKRVGALRFCRSCRYDFDHGVARFETAEQAPVGSNVIDESDAAWSVVPQRAPAEQWSYQPPPGPRPSAKGRVIRVLEWILTVAVLLAAAAAVAVVLNPALLP